MDFLRRYWWLLSMLALAIGIAFLTPHEAQYDAANPYAYQKASEQVSNWDWTLIAAIAAAVFTGILAIVGMVQVRDTRESNERQMRAYLSVVIGGGVYQDAGLRFEGRPIILNNGNTPAYNVRFQITARIISDKASSSFKFSAPRDLPAISQASIGPKENRIMRAVVRKRVPRRLEIPIALGLGSALWVWGVVHYKDAFGRPRHTEFCQRLYWITGTAANPSAQMFGTYDPRFGEST